MPLQCSVRQLISQLCKKPVRNRNPIASQPHVLSPDLHRNQSPAVFSVKCPAGVVCTVSNSQIKITEKNMEFLEQKTGLDKKSIEVG